jgi:Beta-propeller repeat
VSELQGSLAVGRGSAAQQASPAAASVRRCSAALGLLIVLAMSATAGLAERESPPSQLGSAGAQPRSEAPPATLGPPSTSLAPAQAPSTALPAAARRRVESAYARLPLSFIPNRGQADKQVRYYAQGAGYGFYFTQRKAVLALQRGERGEALDLRFVGANPDAELVAADRGTGRVNYFIGGESHTDLPTYGRVVYRDLWPGIDMVFSGRGGGLDYELRLRPGAKLSDIRLAYAGAEGVSLGRGGDLVIDTPLGALRDAAPRSFQRIDGRRVPVSSHYALAGDSYGFAVRGRDRSRPLVIDPGISYSTYLGGSGEEGGSRIAVDSAGAAYVTGATTSTDFPTTAGAFDTSGDTSDAFVTKLNPAGSSLAYSTYLGGTSRGIGDLPGDTGLGIEVDSQGTAYVTGETTSDDFPTTAGALDTTLGGPVDAFVAKLNPAGSGLAYSTYLGGSSFDAGEGIALDATGAAYVTGYSDSYSSDFPTTAGAFDTSPNGDVDAFVTKLNPVGSGLEYSTYLGGSASDFPGGTSIAVDAAGAAYVTGFTVSPDFPTAAGAFDTSYNPGDGQDPLTGTEGFVTKLNPAGSGLAYSTYLGGSAFDAGLGIAVDAAGAAYITGNTLSVDFPTTAGAFDTSFNGFGDAFVTKLNPAGSALAYSTYLGGSTFGNDIVVDSQGAAYVTGQTDSTDFPTTAGAFDTEFNGYLDAFVTKLNPAGTGLAYSTYLGGSDLDNGLGIAVDAAGAAYVAGDTVSPDFPTTAGAFDDDFSGPRFDAFVTKLVPGPPTSTPRCRVTNGGRITADNGDGVTFGGSARSDAAGNVNGEEQDRDHGPAQPQNVNSIRILALTCSPAGTQASIFGEATIDSSGTHAFTIEVQDLAEPGKGQDTYRIVLDTGYDSGVRALQGGNVRIHKP